MLSLDTKGTQLLWSSSITIPLSTGPLTVLNHHLPKSIENLFPALNHQNSKMPMGLEQMRTIIMIIITMLPPSTTV